MKRSVERLLVVCALIGAFDLDGNPRLDGDPDIGCFEFLRSSGTLIYLR